MPDKAPCRVLFSVFLGCTLTWSRDFLRVLEHLGKFEISLRLIFAHSLFCQADMLQMLHFQIFVG